MYLISRAWWERQSETVPEKTNREQCEDVGWIKITEDWRYLTKDVFGIDNYMQIVENIPKKYKRNRTYRQGWVLVDGLQPPLSIQALVKLRGLHQI